MIDLTADIGRLASGAAAWAGQPAAARSRLALETARTTAAVADAWIAAALAIKQAAGPAANPAVRAEETATGPLVTLRLLLVTAGSLADIGRTGLPGLPRPPRLAHRGSDAARIEVEAIPAHGPSGSLHDAAIFPGHRATVRCVDPGGVEAFLRSWREEVAGRGPGTWPSCSAPATSRGWLREIASARSSSTVGPCCSSSIRSMRRSRRCSPPRSSR
jgi:hypothetical protein